MTDIQLLDEQEVSRRLSVSVNTLRYWRVSGDGPNYVKLGRLVRYDAVALEKFILRNLLVKAALLAHQGSRQGRMGLPIKEGLLREHYGPRGFQAVAGSQTVGGYSRIGRSVLCSSLLLNRRDGGNRKRDGGHGCDGTSISQYHAHLQPLKRDADSGSDRASESAVVRSGTVGGHKSGHSHINELCQEMA